MPEEIAFSIDGAFTANMEADFAEYYEKHVPFFPNGVTVNATVVELRVKSLAKIAEQIYRVLLSGCKNISSEHLLCARSIKSTMYYLQVQGEMPTTSVELICKEFDCFRRALFLVQHIVSYEFLSPLDLEFRIYTCHQEMLRSIAEIRAVLTSATQFETAYAETSAGF